METILVEVVRIMNGVEGKDFVHFVEISVWSRWLHRHFLHRYCIYLPPPALAVGSGFWVGFLHLSS